MPLSDRLYLWLASGPTPDCDEILAGALPHAEPPWDARILRVLLERDHDASWGGLIGALDRLPAEVRTAVFANRDKLCAGIATALKARLPSQRLNALAAFAECREA